MGLDIVSEHQVSDMVNLIHLPSQPIKEEIANILLTLSDEFNNPQDLFEIQKFKATKTSDEEVKVNFQE